MPAGAALDAGNLPDTASPGNLCYVIFTSGSTGKPKAAAVLHRGWVNLVTWFVREFAVSVADKVLVISSFSFDITQRSIAMPLICGGQLHLFASNHYDPARILRTIAEQRVTRLNCAPSTFYPLVENPTPTTFESLQSLKTVFLGGEPIAASRMRQWAEAAATELANVYGAAECSDVSSFYRLNDYERYVRNSVPIGKPIANSQVYLLDDTLEPVEIGAIGEICIGGVGVGKGYINDAELTAEKFVRNPFSEEPDARLYRTGDLARFAADRNLELVGRVDHQIKISLASAFTWATSKPICATAPACATPLCCVKNSRRTTTGWWLISCRPRCRSRRRRRNSPRRSKLSPRRGCPNTWFPPLL